VKEFENQSINHLCRLG